jgi:hypothetical protein
MSKIILHAIILKKPFYTTKKDAFDFAITHFPEQNIKGFVRETNNSFRVRVVPKTKFNKTTFRTKKINEYLTLVFGTLL